MGEDLLSEKEDIMVNPKHCEDKPDTPSEFTFMQWNPSSSTSAAPVTNPSPIAYQSTNFAKNSQITVSPSQIPPIEPDLSLKFTHVGFVPKWLLPTLVHDVKSVHSPSAAFLPYSTLF